MIIEYKPECGSLTDDNCNPYPALKTNGCGCCSEALRVTQENIDKAIQEARAWLETLQSLKPVQYPEDVK